MKNEDHVFAIRKDGRDLRRLRRFCGGLFQIALLVVALGLYWQWNHGEPGVGPIFQPERHLAATNGIYFLSAFGLLDSARLIAAPLQALRARAQVRLRK
jgi:hypothetical protein